VGPARPPRRPGDEPFVAFVAELTKKEAEAVVRAVEQVRLAGAKSWQALAWWLERKHPEEWSADREVLRELKRFLKERRDHGPARPKAAPRDH
jgi:hypothetical protein